jgi:hypothetical protein
VVRSKRPTATAAKQHRGQKIGAAAVTTKPDRAHAAILDLLFNGLAV